MSARSAAQRVGSYKPLSGDRGSSTLSLSSYCCYRTVMTFNCSNTVFFGRSGTAPGSLSLARLTHSKMNITVGGVSKTFASFFSSSTFSFFYFFVETMHSDGCGRYGSLQRQSSPLMSMQRALLHKVERRSFSPAVLLALCNKPG